MKIVTIVGARPQFVKAAAVSRSIQKQSKTCQVLIHTGQHYDPNLSDLFFDELKIPAPDYHLEVGGLSHGAMTGRMLEHIEEILVKESPDWVLVFGDTNSTLAGAVAASKLHIPVAHVEAGLRSFNRNMPEEINRILTDHCSSLLFTPTDSATKQLEKEGISSEKIHQVGDVMYDAILFQADQIPVENSKPYILATVHRQENTDDPTRLREILQGLSEVSKRIPILFPLHPRTKKKIEVFQLETLCRGIQLIDPVGYKEMVRLEKNASLIMTDSGGVQKEAYFLQVPCLTLRNETEWVELIENGYNVLVPANRAEIVKAVENVTRQNFDWNKQLYGDGNASDQIISTMRNMLSFI